MDRKIKGKILSGLGQGNYFTQLDWVRKQFKEKLGFDPYPGTLNLKMDKNNQQVFQKIQKKGGIEIAPPARDFCSSNSYRIKFKDVEAAIIVPCVPDYPQDIIEIMAPVNIKEKFKVKDGDELEIIIKETK